MKDKIIKTVSIAIICLCLACTICLSCPVLAASDSMDGDKYNHQAAGEESQYGYLIGDIVTFGAYEQDGNMTNGSEPIEWQVLDFQNGKALIISICALEFTYEMSEPLSNTRTWENSNTRTWLNEIFYEEAFSDLEKAAVCISNVPADANPEYDVYQGNDTEDRIFLLSYDEAERYFYSDADRQCRPTDYLLARAGYTYEDETDNAWWILRSIGGNSSWDSTWGRVNWRGTIDYYCSGVGDVIIAVRPALWINLAVIDQEKTKTASEMPNSFAYDKSMYEDGILSEYNEVARFEFNRIYKQDSPFSF